jgi:hypothetical protein
LDEDEIDSDRLVFIDRDRRATPSEIEFTSEEVEGEILCPVIPDCPDEDRKKFGSDMRLALTLAVAICERQKLGLQGNKLVITVLLS